MNAVIENTVLGDNWSKGPLLRNHHQHVDRSVGDCAGKLRADLVRRIFQFLVHVATLNFIGDLPIPHPEQILRLQPRAVVRLRQEQLQLRPRDRD
ncbi:hypothetical protein PC116_g31359 [Phytophthora cactorum]|nr:hypothetical protein PC116_g31359 [Phytophthora cactorum]